MSARPVLRIEPRIVASSKQCATWGPSTLAPLRVLVRRLDGGPNVTAEDGFGHHAPRDPGGCEIHRPGDTLEPDLVA
jgi:hypothetical protein